MGEEGWEDEMGGDDFGRSEMEVTAQKPL